ncbi:MAG: beta-galactosidase [candidate division KSB1 bacterium]|nr:beta-galactosidase [candidate division KSB1 bacterium]
MNTNAFKSVLLFVLMSVFFACQQTPVHRQSLDLAGEWQFRMDTSNVGIQQQWYLQELTDTIELPGTMDRNQKGFANTDTTTAHLNRLYTYKGPAWYRKTVNIPEEFADKHIQLILERTKAAKIWIDDQYIGESHLLQSPQRYDVSAHLSPGEHSISIRVNNDLKLTPYGNVHIYTDDTQTNWNGIIGDIKLEASPLTRISNLQIFPDIDNRNIKVRLGIVNDLNLDSLDIFLQVVRLRDGKSKKLKSARYHIACDSVIECDYNLGKQLQLWDDYQQPRYTLTAVLNQGLDAVSAPFGMRSFKAGDNQFRINGRSTFLRGKHDACVFPLTGHPPMDVDGWKRVYDIAKSYGINHYRFHSYCPPEAAFTAADELGIFLQPELPFWGGLESDSVAAKLQAEGLAMLKEYANHPSFVMLGPGNEIWSGHNRVEDMINTLKTYDSRPLYSMGANNNIGYVGPRDGSEFFIAARTPSDGDTLLTHTRLAHGFVDSPQGGILNSQEPSTTVNYDYPVEQIDVPLISHEIGQYQIYPDYDEIDKYTGVVRAWNLMVFRNRLKQAGMLDQNFDFHLASGAWSARCYKAEMEAALRTSKFAGFQLLDLQDFPGQGTALVGILDAFMDSKDVVERKTWLQSCNDVTLLLEFPRYCWQSDESFQATLKIANYSNRALVDDITWSIGDQHGNIIHAGTFENLNIPHGGLHIAGRLETRLDQVEQADKLSIRMACVKNRYSNIYPIWVYPVTDKQIPHQDITVAEQLNESVLNKLEQGDKVLLFPEHKSVADKSVGGLFHPDFWNYGMFKSISESVNKPVSPGTLSLLMDPDHPLFSSFPTEFHTNWQWWSIIRAGRPLILDDTPHDYRPLVQMIDNLQRNHKLGFIFEFAVGKGKLLVCMSRLNEISHKPEADQLYKSIVRYMQSEAFAPEYTADRALLKNLL